jgi:nucleoid-associated protein YgaU
MRANRSPPFLFTVALSFCTALLLFAIVRSFLHETAPPQSIFIQEVEQAAQTILLFEGKAEHIPEDLSLLPAPQRKHVVQDRESLSSISKKYYGTETQWEKIWQANQNLIPNHHKIQPGITLVIPQN